MSKEQLSIESLDNIMTSHKTLYEPQSVLAEDLCLYKRNAVCHKNKQLRI